MKYYMSSCSCIMFVVSQQCCEVNFQKVFEINEVLVIFEKLIFHISKQQLIFKEYSLDLN